MARHYLALLTLLVTGIVGAPVDYNDDTIDVFDLSLRTPVCEPDQDITEGSFMFQLFKVKKEGSEECSHQIVEIRFPASEKIKMFTTKTNCKVGRADYPLSKVVLVVKEEEALVFKTGAKECLKATMTYDEKVKDADITQSCTYACDAPNNQKCPEGSSGVGAFTDRLTGGTDLASLLSGGGNEVWSKKYLQSEMSIRIVSKSWSPPNTKCPQEKLAPVYLGDVEEAFDTLKYSPIYDYSEALMEENQAQALLSMQNEAGKVEYDNNLPTIIIVHPLSGHGSVSFVATTVTALAMRQVHRFYNVLVVDMPGLNLNMMMSTIKLFMGSNPNFDLMAAALNEFFEKAIDSGMMKVGDINLVGYSWSGQLVGQMARALETKYKEKIASIIALDPTGNLQNTNLQHVSSEDAKVVHILHTNSYPCGTLARVGTADFTFNNGLIQSECAQAPIPMLCSHHHVVQRWWYMILFGPKLFIARQCENIMKFNAGLCDENPTAVMSYPIDASNPAKGKYFIRTDGHRPYGLRKTGSVCDPQLKEKMKRVVEEQERTGQAGYDLRLFMMLSINVDI